MNQKRKIMYISGSRADYGLMRETLREIEKSKKLDLTILACGMHTLKEFGYTFKEIKKDKLKTIMLKSTYRDDSKQSLTRFLSELTLELGSLYNREKPDMILLLGDRAETLCAAVVATYYSIPIAHIHGGDISSTVDDPVRHAISKLSHIHLAATTKSANRIKRMGEEPKRIHIVGAPGLDRISKVNFLSRQDCFKKLKLKDEDTFVLLYHPEVNESSKVNKQMNIIITVLKKMRIQTIVIYPNADPGSSGIIRSISNTHLGENFKVFRSISHDDYLNLLKYAKLLIGNSSSGIIEAPSLKIPVINIGTRQEGRERANNVIDIECSKHELVQGIKKALSPKFKERIGQNPYGDGQAYRRITKILSGIIIDKHLINKEMTY